VSRADKLATFMCRFTRDSGCLNLLEPPRPVQACGGIALPLPLPSYIDYIRLLYCDRTLKVEESDASPFKSGRQKNA
jgi:hypothetical protein